MHADAPQNGQARFRVGENADLDALLRRARAAVEAHAQIVKEPAPKVFLDRTATENALEIVVTFSTRGDPVSVKSDLIKAMHQASAEYRRKDAA